MKLNQYFVTLRRWFLDFLNDWSKRKNKCRKFACFYENPSNVKDWFGSRVIIYVPASLPSLVDFLQYHPSLDTGINSKLCKNFEKCSPTHEKYCFNYLFLQKHIRLVTQSLSRVVQWVSKKNINTKRLLVYCLSLELSSQYLSVNTFANTQLHRLACTVSKIQFMFHRKGIVQPQSQFNSKHSCVSERFIYSQDQIYECRNLETEYYNSVLEITRLHSLIS